MNIGITVVIGIFAAEELISCLEYLRFARYHRKCALSSFHLIILAALCATITFLSQMISLTHIKNLTSAISVAYVIIIVFIVSWVSSILVIYFATTDHIFAKNRYQIIQMLCLNLQQASWSVIRSPWRVLFAALTNKCGALIALATVQSLAQCIIYMLITSTQLTLHSSSITVMAFIVTTLWNTLLFITLYRVLVFYPTHEFIRILAAIITTITPILSHTVFVSGQHVSRESSSSSTCGNSIVFIAICVSFILLCLVKSILAADARQRLQHLLRSESAALTDANSIIEEVSISLRRKRAERRQVQVRPLTSLPRIYPTQTMATPSGAPISMPSKSDLSEEEDTLNQV